mgnify:CR=1 FL=1
MPYTADFYRGLLVRDPRFSADNVTISPASQQAGPTVDAFTGQSGSEGYMELEATGTSTADKSYTIRCSTQGAAIAGDPGGRFAWRPTEAGDEDSNSLSWRGQWPDPFISGAKVWQPKTGAQLRTCWPSMISTEDNYVHCAYMYLDAGTPTNNGVRVATLNPATDTWSEVTVTTSVAAPSLVELDSGRLVLFTHDAANDGYRGTAMRRFYSDDRGATWVVGYNEEEYGSESFGLLANDFNFGSGGSMTNFQVVHHNGYLTMIRTCQTPRAGVSDSDLDAWGTGSAQAVETDHYVSRDYGATWQFLERFQRITTNVGRGTSTKNLGICPQIIADDLGTVFLLYIHDYDEPISGKPRFLKKGSPYGKFAEDPAYNTDHSLLGLPGGTAGSTGANKSAEPRKDSANHTQAGHFVMCKDRRNKLVVLCNHGNSGSGTYPNQHSTGCLFRYDMGDLRYLLNDYRSHVNGWFDCADKESDDTQFTLFDMTGAAVSGGITGYYQFIRQSACVAYKDRILCLMNAPTSTQVLGGATTGGHVLVELGGASNLDSQVGFSTLVDVSDPARQGFTYLPIDSPAQMVAEVAGFTSAEAGGGTVTFTIDPLGLKFETSSKSISFSHAGTWIHARINSATVASFSSGDINGSYQSIEAGGVELRIGKNTAQAFDMTPGYALAVKISNALTLTAGARDWMVGNMTNSYQAPAATSLSAAIWYKAPTENTWTRFPTFQDTLKADITAANERLADASGVLAPRWGVIQTGTSTAYWEFANIYSGYYGTKWGFDGGGVNRRFGRSFSIYPQWINDGWKIASQGSVAFMRDEWRSSTRYEYPIEAAHPEVSPSPRVEWRSVNDTTETTITWNPQGSTKTKPNAAAWGVHLEGVNWGSCFLEKYDGSSWSAVATISTEADGAGLKYAITGDTFTRDTSDSSTMGADRYYHLDELVDCYVVFAPNTGSESVNKIKTNSEGGFYKTNAGAVPSKDTEIRIETSATTPAATGTCTIRQSAVTAIVTATNKFEQLRIRIPAQKTAEGYFKAGAIMVGDVFIWGTDYSWGRLLTLEPNQEITTARTGDRLVEQLGPHRRRVEFAWTEGWDSTNTSGEDPTAYTAVNQGGKAVSVREDPALVEGVLMRAKGAAEPVVYLPRIPYKGSGTATQEITGRDRHMYGRIVSKVTRQMLIGDEDENEVQSINAITIDEEI